MYMCVFMQFALIRGLIQSNKIIEFFSIECSIGKHRRSGVFMLAIMFNASDDCRVNY